MENSNYTGEFHDRMALTKTIRTLTKLFPWLRATFMINSEQKVYMLKVNKNTWEQICDMNRTIKKHFEEDRAKKEVNNDANVNQTKTITVMGVTQTLKNNEITLNNK